MQKMVKVDFYDSDYLCSEKFIYSVIAAKSRKGWVFVRHHSRNTFEIPGGHIEENETPLQAAERELFEETGALLFTLKTVCTYSVTIDGETRFGKLFYAEIEDLGPVPDISEIAEITFMDNLPDPVTYPEIQPHLFKKVLHFLADRY
jgi:8-oxo-dGTP diphosphatase